MLELRNPKVAVPVVLFAGILWSFGPLVVRYMENPNTVPWQYIFGRGLTIFIILNLYLYFEEGIKFWKNYLKIGKSGITGGIGLGLAIFIVTLFSSIVIGKSLSRAVTWTGVGSIDKYFGLIFGFFKGYIVSVCIFSISNWFYPYQNWGISAEDAFSFDFISKGSKILIEEFPSSDDFIDTKEKIEKI